MNQPNLILIMTDQQRGDCLGIDGHPVLQTPNLDYLAASGTRFRRGYSECPICVPARRCLMTGTSPAANGVVGWHRPEWNPANTLAGVLGEHGYQTHHIGKLHINSADGERFGYDYGEWNEMYSDWLREVHRHPEHVVERAHGVSNNSSVGRPHFLPEEQMQTFWLFDRALRFLRYREPSSPFFLKISITDPHPPFTPPQHYYDRYLHRDMPPPAQADWSNQFADPTYGSDPNAPEARLSEHALQCTRAGYYGLINFVDDQIGRFMNEAGRLRKDTLFIFVSDHGEMLGDHQMFTKSWPYEASVRIPFIVRAPQSWNLTEGIVSDAPVGLQDVMPTFLDAAGIPIPDTCTGHSLLPIVRSESDRVREVLHGECANKKTGRRSFHYLTDGKMKYIWFSQTGKEQLFDIKKDPQELHDLLYSSRADAQVQPWRDRLIDVLRDRPEGFTDGTQLIAGQTHNPLVPNYDPNRMTQYL